MGNISKSKLAGISFILGPIITTICYFIQQLVIFPDVEWDKAASWAAAGAQNNTLLSITGIIISITLLMLVYGILFIANEIKGNGNGDALATYSVPMILTGLIGFIFSSGMFIAGANFPEPVAAAEAVYLAATGINSISGIFFSLGFATIFFAMASREEYNKMFANIAGLIAIIALILSIIGSISVDSAQTMTQIVGLTYIIHTIYAIYIGYVIINRE
ncbi:MAG: hypothetical protein ACJ0A6_03985 [Dehalococcoidia bacterium]